ncbi:MAG: FAD-dependent oxidoreductase, partial [Polyangiaceae bacterium]
MSDVVIIGSGPNDLAAAVFLAQAGASVLVLEAADEIGGGMRTAELTLPGFAHDVCAAVHPMGILSPYFRTLPLEAHGLDWIRPRASVAHPLDDQPAVLLRRSLEETAAELELDGPSYRRLIEPFL